MPPKSPLDSIAPETLDALRQSVKAGAPWRDILAGLADSGVATSESALRRWCDRNDLKKDAAWHSPSQRDELLRRAQAAAAGDTKETLRAQLEHAQAELKAADAAIRNLRKAANRDLAIGMTVEAAVSEHFSGTRTTLAPFTAPRKEEGTAQEFLAHVSDLHYGEFVDPELAMGISYSPEIARARMAYLRDKIIRYADLRPYAISHLHVAVLGDMVSGANHEDLDVTNARGQVDQALDVAELLYAMAVDFSDRFERVSFYVITGNHGRLHQKPRHKQRYENWDYVSGRVLQTMVNMSLRDGVIVEAPRASRHIIEVAGRRVALMHGDGVKAANFAGIPWYSMKSKRDAMQSMLRSLGLPAVDQISMGHLHQHAHIPSDCNIVVNGSIKGGDEYVLDTRMAHTPAMQIVQEWHPKYGLTTTDYITFEDSRR